MATRSKWRWDDVSIARGVNIHSMYPEPTKGLVSEDAPGLAVTAGVALDGGRWVITHIASGLKMPLTFPERELAEKVAVLLGELTDWRSSDYRLICDDPETRAAVQTILRPFA